MRITEKGRDTEDTIALFSILPGSVVKDENTLDYFIILAEFNNDGIEQEIELVNLATGEKVCQPGYLRFFKKNVFNVITLDIDPNNSISVL